MPGRACRPVATHWRRTRDPRTVRNPVASTTASGRASPRASPASHRAQRTLDRWQPVPSDAANNVRGHVHGTRPPAIRGQRGPAPERRSWVSASPVTSVRRQPPRTVRERPRPSARMVTGLSSAIPQSSDSPTHMIQSVDASASQKTSPLVRPSGRRPRVSSARATRRRPCRPLFRVAPRTPFGCGGADIDTTPGAPRQRSRTLGTGERRPR